MAIINSTLSNTLLSGTSSNDTIQNGGWWYNGNYYGSYAHGGSNVTINTGAGNDSVNNGESESVTINTGAGNDYVENWHGSSVTINTGAGNDSVVNCGDKATIDFGTGNDYVENRGSKVTIICGKGNDSIYNNCWLEDDGSIYYQHNNYGSNVLFKYSTGDGNDIIYGFKKNSTLSIGGDSYSSTKSGKDIIVTVGEGHITLVGATRLSAVHIVGEESSTEMNVWKLSGTRATYGTSTNTLITVSGVKSLSGISLSGKVVTVAQAALNQANVTLSGSGYTLKLANDVKTATTSNDWSYKNSAATLSQTKGAYYSLANDGKSISYSAGTSKTLATVSGVKSADGISVKKKVITVAAAALNQSKVTLSGSGYKLKIGSDVSTTAATSNTWSYKSSVATLKQTKGAYYSLASDGKSISYSAGTSKTLATVSGVKSASGLSVKKKVITVAQAALNQSKVTLSGSGYTLKLANDVSTTAATSNAWSYKSSVATLKQTKGAYYSLASDGKSISYSAGTSSTLATVSGVKSTDGLSVKKKVITVAQAALNQSKVTLSGSGYTLKLANDVSTTAATSNAWSYKNSVATLSQTKGAYYSLASDAKSISYSAGTSSTLATIKGAKSTSGLSFNSNKITLKNSALNKKVTVSGSYEFDFASDYKKAAITGSAKADTITSRGNNISITGGKGNDVINLATAAKNNLIVYKSGDGKDIINGLTEDDTIKIASGAAHVSTNGADVIFTVGKGSITVKDAADKNFIYIAGGVKETYSAVAAEPYTISGAEIILSTSYSQNDFNVADYGEELETIDASAVNHALNITGNYNDNKIIGSSKNDTLDGYGGDDTLTGGDGADIFLYYEGDGNDVITDYAANDTIAIEDGEVIPTVKGRDVILKVGEEKITVQNAAKNKVGVTYTENGFEYDYINGKQAVVVSNANATLTKDYWKNNFDVDNFGSGLKQIDASAVTRNLKITGNDKANLIMGGTGDDTLIGGKGNDTLQGGDGANLYVYNDGDGNDRVISWGDSDSISIASGVLSDINVKGDTAILKIGKGKISIQGASGELNYWEDGKAYHTILGGANSDNVLEDDNFINGNSLGSIIESKAVDYSFLIGSTRLLERNNLVVFAKKK